MDDFSDDGFDGLDANALQELENSATQFTQGHKKVDLTQKQLDFEFEDDDLDDAVVTDELRGNPVLLPEQQSAASSSRIAPQQQQQQQPQQNGWGPVPIPAGHFRPQAVGSAARPPAQVALGPGPSQAATYSQMRPPPRPTPTIPSRYQASQATGPGPTSAEQAVLEARVRDLQQKLQAKDGEIHIVRSRSEKYRRDHERELQALKKQTAEQLAKHERAVESAKVAERTATTELEFTRRDLKEELDRAKRKEKDGGTPKKNATVKALGVSDGFEDVEMAGSPSKGNRGRNPGAVATIVPEPPARLMRTPTKGKRKRPATMESPVMALETTEDVIMMDDGDDVFADKVDQASSAVASPRKPLPYDFLKVILNHSSAHGRPLTFDFLAGFALPSKPTDSLASIIFQKLAVIDDHGDPMRLPVEFCEQIVDLWLQCRKEGCLAPIAELISLISFTLNLNTIAVAPYIAETLVSAAMDSCYEIGIPRLHSTTGDPTDDVFKNLKDNIPTSDILSVMYLVALGCSTSPPIRGALSSPMVDFWNCVHPDFVLMMIRNHNQPVDDFITMLRLLCTSVFEDTIGPISSSPNRTVDVVAPAMIERLTYHLLETHQWNVSHQKRWIIRYALLRALAAFARSPFGMTQLATHDYAIPRLVMFLSWSIDELYDGDSLSPSYVLPPLSNSSSSSSPKDQVSPEKPAESQQRPNELQTLISHITLLLHTIITHKPTRDIVNVPGKLAKFTGGSQKYLLSLARLNFAEEGVSEETAELAHELLEQAVTEEEGAELGEIFGG
ncbi:hypothetical protein BJ170DRAFT_691102 [Xylariales sp. AK1849]|nr:hypothetical protein BJ170DRAFT_691102 [Xylariales sp. AK1849]